MRFRHSSNENAKVLGVCAADSNFVYFYYRFRRVEEMLWLACGAVVILAGFYALAPLFKESEDSSEMGLPAETERDRLLHRKAVLYSTLKDLELEYAMGRLSDSDFHQLSSGYKSEAATILQRLDQL
jgi:hypothetical protein